MFDRTVVLPGRARTEYVTRTVKEQHAPTDESVKLLAEMEKAAEAKLIGSMRMEGNAFSGVVHMWESMQDQQRHLKAVFDINGSRQEVAVNEWSNEPFEALLAALHEAVAKRIASEILVNITRGFTWPRR